MRIAHNIEYIQPDAEHGNTCCSGLIVSSLPSIYIDTNIGAATLAAFLRAGRPDIAIASHYHSDHCAFLKPAQELCGSRVFIPEGEEKCFMDLESHLDQCAGASGEDIRALWKMSMLDRNFKVIDEFELHFHEKSFRSGDTTIECIRCAGHSPSHTCFYLPEEKVLFATDMGVGSLGPVYVADDCNLKEFVSSVLKLRGIETEVVLTSHGGALNSSEIEPAWNRCLNHFLVLERFIRTRLDQGKTKWEIVDALLQRTSFSKAMGPYAKLMKAWVSVAFDLHYAVLLEGGLPKLFPELQKLDGVFKS